MIKHQFSGAKLIYNKLIQHKVDTAFVYTGGAIMPLIDQLYNQKKINYFINTHEQSAGHSASAYARTSGKTGISIMTSGPGVTNSITALTDATNDSTPLLLLTGNVPISAVGTNAFQECPAVELTKPITKWSHFIKSVQEIPYIMDKAFYIANNGKPGAVHLDIPKCVLSDFYDLNIFKKDNREEKRVDEQKLLGYDKNERKYYIKNNFKNNFKDKVKKSSIDPYDKKNIENIIANAKKPVIIVGQGCNDFPDLLRNFAINSNIPVTSTIHAMGIFDETHKLSLEFLGMHGNVAANYAVQNSDLIIAIGSRFDDRITGNISEYAPEAFKAFKENRGGIIHVNINNKEIDKIINTHYNFNMCSGEFLENIKPVYKKRTLWLQEIKKWKKLYQFSYKKTEKLKTQEVLEELNKHLLERNNYIITTGVGNHQMMACQFIKWRYPKTMVTSGSLGVMGVGLPFAIGCQIANPESMIIDIDGDGSFNHTLSELKTVENYNLPIKIAIMNDGHFSMVRTWEKLFFKEQYTATNLYKNPNYVKLAEAYDIKAIKCEYRETLNQTISEFLSYKGPILCEFKVESDQCFPLVKPGAALDNIMIDEYSNQIKEDESIMAPN